MTMIELIVHMDCAGCEYKIKKALQKLEGVDDVDVDINMQKVTVMGWARQQKILKAIKKTGMKADLWPYSPEFQHNVVIQDYYQHYDDNNNHHHHDDDDHHHHRHHTTAHDAPVSASVMSYNYLTFMQNNNTKAGHDVNQLYYYPTPYSTLVDHKATVIFSDENPHACSIM